MAATSILLDSNNGFQTKCWGPPMWFVLHTISLNYRVEYQKGYMQFFKSLQYVLPCKACRINYAKTIKTHPTLRLTKETFKSRESLAYWLFKLHNFVTECNKKEVPMYKNTKKDFGTMVKSYSKFRATCKLPTKTEHGGCVNPLQGGIKMKTKMKFVPYKK
jgi:hypothetical protein